MENINEARQKVGCFTALAIFVFVGFLFWISGGSGGPIFTANRVRYVVTFDDITGLRTNAAVTIAGRPVGEVIETERFGKQARVIMAIDRSVEIYGDALFTLVRPSLLGTPYIVLDPGTPGTTEISYNPYDTAEVARQKEQLRLGMGPTHSKSSSGLNEVMSESQEALVVLTRILKSFELHQEQLMGSMHVFLNESSRSIQLVNETLESKKLDAILENIQTLSSELSGIVADNRERVGDMLDKINGTLDTTQEQLALRSAQLGELMDTLNASLAERIDPLLQNLVDLTRALDQVVGDNDRNLHETIVNLRHATENLQGFTARIRANPSLLVFGDNERRDTETERRLQIDRDLRDNGRLPLYDKRTDR